MHIIGDSEESVLRNPPSLSLLRSRRSSLRINTASRARKGIKERTRGNSRKRKREREVQEVKRTASGSRDGRRRASAGGCFVEMRRFVKRDATI